MKEILFWVEVIVRKGYPCGQVLSGPGCFDLQDCVVHNELHRKDDQKVERQE